MNKKVETKSIAETVDKGMSLVSERPVYNARCAVLHIENAV